MIAEVVSNPTEDVEIKDILSKKKEQFRVDIRKKQTNEILRQRRLVISEQPDMQRYKDFTERDSIDFSQLDVKRSISQFMKAYKSQNKDLIRFEVHSLRLCVTMDHKISDLEYSNEQIYENNILHILINYLAPEYDADDEDLQRDVIWIVSHFLGKQNLKHILYIISNVSIQVFYRIFENCKEQIKSHTLNSIYNILFDNQVGAQYLLNGGICEFICQKVIPSLQANPSLVEQTSLIIKEIFEYALKGTSNISSDQLVPLLKSVEVLFGIAENSQLILNTLFEAVYSFTQREDDQEIEMLNVEYNGIVLRVLAYLKEQVKLDSAALICPLRIVYNLTNSYDTITESMIQQGLLNVLSSLAKHRSNKIKRMIASILTNVCACGKEVFHFILQHRVIVYDILNLMESTDFMLKKEAVVALCHLLMTISIKKIEEFISDYDPLKSILEHTRYVDVDLNTKILKAFVRVVKAGEFIKTKKNYFYNTYSKMLLNYGGYEKVSPFLESTNETLSKLANKLLNLLQNSIDDEAEAEQAAAAEEEGVMHGEGNPELEEEEEQISNSDENAPRQYFL